MQDDFVGRHRRFSIDNCTSFITPLPSKLDIGNRESVVGGLYAESLSISMVDPECVFCLPLCKQRGRFACVLLKQHGAVGTLIDELVAVDLILQQE